MNDYKKELQQLKNLKPWHRKKIDSDMFFANLALTMTGFAKDGEKKISIAPLNALSVVKELKEGFDDHVWTVAGRIEKESGCKIPLNAQRIVFRHLIHLLEEKGVDDAKMDDIRNFLKPLFEHSLDGKRYSFETMFADDISPDKVINIMKTPIKTPRAYRAILTKDEKSNIGEGVSEPYALARALFENECLQSDVELMEADRLIRVRFGFKVPTRFKPDRGQNKVSAYKEHFTRLLKALKK